MWKGQQIVGDIVAIKVDIRDVSHLRGIRGVVCRTTTKGAGGVMVATTAGILCHGDTKRVLWVPRSKYRILDAHVVVSRGLRAMQEQVVIRKFNPDLMKRVSLKKCTCIFISRRNHLKKALLLQKYLQRQLLLQAIADKMHSVVWM